MIAQVDVPPEGLASGYYSPLIFAAIVYTALFVASRVLEGRGDKRSEQLEDVGFVVLLLSAAYVVVILLVALASEVDLVWDMVRIVVVVAVFFGVLALLLLAVFELGIGGISRLRGRREN